MHETWSSLSTTRQATLCNASNYTQCESEVSQLVFSQNPTHHVHCPRTLTTVVVAGPVLGLFHNPTEMNFRSNPDSALRTTSPTTSPSIQPLELAPSSSKTLPTARLRFSLSRHHPRYLGLLLTLTSNCLRFFLVAFSFSSN
ncbi:hypothetical protein CC79DRAFT_121742 [Sarocladium strictum]